MLNDIFADPSVLAIFVALIWAVLILIRRRIFRRLRRPTVPPVDVSLPQNAIVVDGSNVMHWGDAPSTEMIQRVLQALIAKGYAPIVFFDANVGYVLSDRYFNEAKLSAMINLPERQICVVNKGVVADEMILAFASDHKLRIVTNDKYRDWRVQFPHADKKGTLIGGAWREGSVFWRGKL